MVAGAALSLHSDTLGYIRHAAGSLASGGPTRPAWARQSNTAVERHLVAQLTDAFERADLQDLGGLLAEDVTGDEEPKLKAVLDRCPGLRAASDQVRGFAVLITGLTGQDLPQWMAAAREAALPGIASFAKGLEQDLDAATNGLTMDWSSGPVDHIKMVKCQMFDRAGLLLLRQRVLLTAQQ